MRRSLHVAWNGIYLPNPRKDAVNREKHGVGFVVLRGFEWDSALEIDATRAVDGERRTKAIGFVGAKLYVFVFVRLATRIRPISLRRAHRKEIRFYVDFYE